MDIEGPGNNRPNSGVQGNFPGQFSSSVQEPASSTNYTIPGILHFIKHEWSRFEKERATWEVQKAELEAKIAFLQGERKGHENLMHDLIRRIKMLEFALKQERVKLYKALHGKDLVFADMNPPTADNEHIRGQLEMSSIATHREESRKVLRDYLREVGFPDNVLEARVARMTAYRSLYGQNQLLDSQQGAGGRTDSPAPPSLPSYPSTTSPSTALSIPTLPNGPVANGTDMQVQGSHTAQHETGLARPLDGSENEGSPSEGEDVNAVFNAFEFLGKEDSDEDDEDDEEGEEVEESWSSDLSASPGGKLPFELEGAQEDDEDDETESALDDFQQGSPAGETQPHEDRHRQEFSQQLKIYSQNKPRKSKKSTDRPSRQELKFMAEYKKQTESQSSPDQQQQQQQQQQQPQQQQGQQQQQQSSASSQSSMGMMRIPGRGSRKSKGKYLDLGAGGLSDTTFEAAVLGELAVISLEPPETTNVESSRKWEHKYSLQSHFDSVTSIAFHPTDQVVLTGSEDCTIKVWNLQRARQKVKETRRSLLVDVEALDTLRGHRGHVLSVVFGIGGEICFSGSADSSIRVWQIPAEPGEDPFDLYDPEIHQGVLTGHRDAVWDLSVHPTTGLLLSCAADGSCRLWNHTQSSPLVREFVSEQRFGNPTSIDYMYTNLHQMVASYSASKIVAFDLETGQSVLNFDSSGTYDGTSKTQINKVVCHPTLPIAVSAHEDKYIRFYDTNTGKLIHYMTAHMDAVAGLAIDPHGLYLMSGGHDGSLRFWSMDSKMCIQEIGGAHRRRFDESIRNLACHSSEPLFASAGSDGIAKVYI